MSWRVIPAVGLQPCLVRGQGLHVDPSVSRDKALFVPEKSPVYWINIWKGVDGGWKGEGYGNDGGMLTSPNLTFFHSCAGRMHCHIPGVNTQCCMQVLSCGGDCVLGVKPNAP